jgi:hypothetical protein
LEIHRAIQNVPPGTKGLKLEKYLYDGTKKFVEHLEADGFELVSRPRAYPMPRSDGTLKPITSKNGLVTMWIPNMRVMEYDHPLSVNDADQYVIVARVERPPKEATIDIPDDFLRRHGVPAGWKLL